MILSLSRPAKAGHPVDTERARAHRRAPGHGRGMPDHPHARMATPGEGPR
jgi:hypothetical protein